MVENTKLSLSINSNIDHRRTFAIISHPDAGKTTLTEKFLLYGGAIQLAGQVRAKGNARRAHSDFIKIEQDRGISVSTSAMSFSFDGHWLNLIDTPGHADFSEDTYRTLTAVDFVIMVIDGAKGIESQTKKLFEICRLRDLPIITFCNKMDRESRDFIDIIDEIQENLAIDVAPINWPIGSGKDFSGCFNILEETFEPLEKQNRNLKVDSLKADVSSKNKILKYISSVKADKLFEELEMIKELLPSFDLKAFREGSQTPIWFGSAINSFSIKNLLEGITKYGPEPNSQKTKTRVVFPNEKFVSGFVFKVQANMDKKHRDRVAFVRLCSGHFKRGMKLKHIRSGKIMTISNPIIFMANDRDLVNEAWAGDIIGIPNHGQLRIGDSLTESEELKFTGIPSFAPELLKTVRATDPIKAKHLAKALTQFAEEGAAKLFKPKVGAGWIIGVVGALQFEVLASRIENEYDVPVSFEGTQFTSARWITGPDLQLNSFIENNKGHMAIDNDGDLVYLTRIQWDIDRVERDHPELKLNDIKETQV